jgi:hypothetical protein
MLVGNEEAGEAGNKNALFFFGFFDILLSFVFKSEPTLIMSVPVDIICTGFRLQRRFSVVVSSSSAFMSLIFTNLSVAGPVQIGIFFFTCDATTKLAKDKHDSVSRFISLPGLQWYH